jgi:pimeloyl-ACP methyl ester carboxylesterase
MTTVGNEAAWDKSVRVDGRTVYYRHLLPAPATPSPSSPVLLLHGLAGSGEVWLRCLRLLANSESTRVVFAPDMPGCGCSPGPRDALDIEQMADWAARFLNAVGAERAEVVGHSMGCQVALAFAERHPNRVGGLILVGPTTGKRTVPVWRYVVGMAFGSSREPLVYRALAVRMFFRMGIKRYLATVRAMMNDDALRRAARVTAPTLVVRGLRDAIVPAESARALAETMPHGSLCTVSNASHVVPFNSAAAMTEIALAFWTRTHPLASSDTRQALRRSPPTHVRTVAISEQLLLPAALLGLFVAGVWALRSR